MLPTAIAVVEAIAGTAHADQVAKQLGVKYWGAEHNSDAFKITSLDYLIGAKNAYLSSRDVVGVPVADGVDEIAVALTAEAYSNTLRSKVKLIGAKTKEIRTKGGLVLVADAVEGDGTNVDFRLADFDATPSGQIPDKVLADITRRYGARTARFVVLDWEYPGQAP